MKHEELQILLSAYHDGEASPAERSLVEIHLARCAECAAMLEGYRHMAGAVRALPRGEPSPELWWRVREALPTRRGRPVWLRLVPLASTAALLLLAVTLALVFGLGRPVGPTRTGAPAHQGEQSQPTDRLAAPAPTAPPQATGAEQAQPTTVGLGVPVPGGICPGQPLALEVISLTVRSDEARSLPRLQGTVYDAEGRPLAGVTLVVSGTAGWKGGTTTASDGTFSLGLPAEGTYRVVLALTGVAEEATADGMKYTWSEAGLEGAETCQVPPEMELSPVSLSAHDEAILILRVR